MPNPTVAERMDAIDWEATERFKACIDSDAEELTCHELHVNVYRRHLEAVLTALDAATGDGSPRAQLQAVDALNRIREFAEEIERATQPGDAQMCSQHIQAEVKKLLAEPCAAGCPEGFLLRIGA